MAMVEDVFVSANDDIPHEKSFGTFAGYVGKLYLMN
jgi:hypothetical protein